MDGCVNLVTVIDKSIVKRLEITEENTLFQQDIAEGGIHLKIVPKVPSLGPRHLHSVLWGFDDIHNENESVSMLALLPANPVLGGCDIKMVIDNER